MRTSRQADGANEFIGNLREFLAGGLPPIATCPCAPYREPHRGELESLAQGSDHVICAGLKGGLHKEVTKPGHKSRLDHTILLGVVDHSRNFLLQSAHLLLENHHLALHQGNCSSRRRMRKTQVDK